MNTITKATTRKSSKPTSRSNPYASFNTTSRSKRTYSQKKQKKQKKQSMDTFVPPLPRPKTWSLFSFDIYTSKTWNIH